MVAIKDRGAREKFVRARTNLLVSNGFFGFLAMQLRVVECVEHLGRAIQTMAVDGKNIFYNPKFVHELDERECEGVICHEVMHCAFQHFSRRQSRDPLLWNVAGDFVINADLLKAGLKLPGKPISLEMIMAGSKTKGHLFDAKLANMTTEAIYDKLVQVLPKVKILMNGGQGGGIEGLDDPGGCGGVIDAPGSGAEKEETQQTWETSVRMAVETAKANGAGNIPGSLQKLVDQLKKPKVSWKEKTRRFIDSAMAKQVSWSRLSRRSWSCGTLMPGFVADGLHHLVFFTDISGSISFEMCVQMVSEVAGALDEGVADKITVAYADTKVKHVDEYYKGDVVKAGRYDGGGTDFADSFRWLRENAPDASCVIYLTDLQVNNFGEEPPCPVLWAVYSPDQSFEALAERAPFGQAIHIDNVYY